MASLINNAARAIRAWLARQSGITNGQALLFMFVFIVTWDGLYLVYSTTRAFCR
jgi:hypothetical protein